MAKKNVKTATKKVAAPKVKSPDLSVYLGRINRISGQVLGIKKMIENNKDRVEILVQMKAARSALKAVEALILEEHFQIAVAKLSTGNAAQQNKKITDLKKLFLRSE